MTDFRFRSRSITLLLLLLPLAAPSRALAQRRGADSVTVYKSRIEPNWLAGGKKLWYRNDLPGERREFILVDAEQASRQRAFDHEQLAAALKSSGINSADADCLPIESLQFNDAATALEFQSGQQSFACDLTTYKIRRIEGPTGPKQLSTSTAAAPAGDVRRSRTTGPETELTFVNRTLSEVELFWYDPSGQRHSYGKLAPDGRKPQHTYAGHVWEAIAPDGSALAAFVAEEAATTAIIEANGGTSSPRTTRQSFRGDREGRSPDGKWQAAIKDHNIVLRGTDDNREVSLTTDGAAGQSYGMLQWSPDSQTLVAFRITPAEQKDVYLIESSPRGGGRAVLHQRPYAQPGDPMTTYEVRLFSAEKQAAIECNADRIDFGTPRIRFHSAGHKFTYEQVDRGHQRFRLVEVDCFTGAMRNLIDERSETFLWTAHTEGLNLRPVHWLDNTDEIIYVSERDGWRHLYVIDARSGTIKNQITQGAYVVRGIEHIDEDGRQVWLRASGMNAGEDPYFIHHYRVNFDGTNLVALTAGNGNHTVQYSPDRNYLIDTYSRIDQPPVHELRRTSDGKLVCHLEQADSLELTASGWQAPEVFHAKGRDGQTDIWGIICRPKDFDLAKKYPVIEQIYAGPHGSFVPKSISSQRRFASLTDAGFVVVQIDGMGTANRSKAFHDVCWKNLKDAGLPDRILWHKAVAAKYPWYDISRVGIYGTSAGGQNSTAALLFHPDFYKVGVSACGCHDNRLDKASWNEQWMGYPAGPHYAECSNIDNAGRLEGKLLLIVGEMDTNVPPESTYRLADALIKAGKDFDLIVVPGAGHGMGGTYGSRRMQDFFIRHLLKIEPPDRNSAD